MSALDPSAAAPAPVPSGRKVCTGCSTINQVTSVYCHKCGLELPEEAATESAIRPAGFWIRLVALIVDQVLLFVVIRIVLLVNGDQQSTWVADLGPGLEVIDLLWDIAMPLALEAVYFTVAIGTWGRTVGKALLQIKVVRADGSNVSIVRAFGRYLAYLLNGLTFGFSFLVIALSPQKRGLHDYIADTRVDRV